MLRVAVAAVLAGLAAGACGESGSGVVGLSGGVQSGPVEAVTVPVDCRAQVERMRREWEAQLAVGAKEDPATRFPNLTRAQFDERLGEAEAKFGFRVVESRWLVPMQAAPVVVVQWDDAGRLDNLASLEHDIEGTFELLDPTQPDTGGPAGRNTFEGFYFEARDADGLPFLANGTYSRGSDQGGARWTRFHEFVLRPAPPAISPPRDLVCL